MPQPLRSAALLVTFATLTACGGATTSSRAAAGREEVLTVAVGFYPYEFVAERIGGPDVTVTTLAGPGVEPHDLELTPKQVAAVGAADLVVYSAGFQPAVDEAVEQVVEGRGFDVLAAVETLPAGEHSGDEPDAHAGEDQDGADPHVWLDPTRLASIGTALAARLGKAAPAKAEAFRARAAALDVDLAELDRQMRTGLQSCSRREIFTSHDAYGYLAAAYDLAQVPVAGLSPEDEASARRLAEVAAQARKDEATTIFFEELVSPKVAQSLAREVGARATVLSPLESQPDEGDYLTAMSVNLRALQDALGCR